MNDIYEALKRLAADPEGHGVLVEITGTTGSSPRKAGARMLLSPDGTFSGTVGGGGLEYHAERLARQVLLTGRAEERTYSLGADRGEAIGAICGGSATVAARPIGAAEAGTLLSAQDAPTRIHIYGAGHVSKALADALQLLGFAVTVCDERAALLTPERFPHAERRLCASMADAPVAPAPGDLIAVMTHSHAFDYEIARRALMTEAPYVGLIASRRKADLFRERFLRDGVPEAALTRLRCPIGLPIRAETPEEIAVSIAAELIAFLHPPRT